MSNAFQIFDLFIMIITIGYVLIVVLIGDYIQKKTNSPDFSRKFIHIFAGFSILSTFFLNWAWLSDIIAGLFVTLIFLASPKSPIEFLRKMFSSMAREDEIKSGHIWGPLYYAISILILTAIFTFPYPTINLVPYYIFPAASLSIMYLGDGFAPIIGKKYGKKQIKLVRGATRTVIGSMTVLIMGFLGSFGILYLFGYLFYGILSILGILILSIIGSISATIIELFSPNGLDNLFLPILTTIILLGINYSLLLFGI
ncbi:MAG: diacylglycerol/polyprenol kinase family protein [Candidatus Helarchaeota archaeon]